MSKYTTVTVSASTYEDYVDSLAAAVEDYVETYSVEAWQVEAAWTDANRDSITLTVPVVPVDVDGETVAVGTYVLRYEDESEDLGGRAAIERQLAKRGLCLESDSAGLRVVALSDD